MRTARNEAHIPAAPQTTNGDEERYRDKCGTYSKGILQDGIGLVNLGAFASFKRALNSGNPACSAKNAATSALGQRTCVVRNKNQKTSSVFAA
jgi:hypothetical protein